ncbi:MAG: hypothetical protein JXQ90_12065 [Cyclobacteriaceae bacterium]
MSDWQKVFEDSTLYRVEIVKAILETEGYDAVIVSKKDTNYQFGQYELHVQAESVIPSIKLIKEKIKFE